jgi:hypothetical protein
MRRIDKHLSSCTVFLSHVPSRSSQEPVSTLTRCPGVGQISKGPTHPPTPLFSTRIREFAVRVKNSWICTKIREFVFHQNSGILPEDSREKLTIICPLEAWCWVTNTAFRTGNFWRKKIYGRPRSLRSLGFQKAAPLQLGLSLYSKKGHRYLDQKVRRAGPTHPPPPDKGAA